ncbi:alpha/beta hydrolase [Paracoccus sp. TOH]|uniref:alpha/beta hydrolase n=1 Tax=Paracoccus sp. TOH TaxID=1263728 RepID=UPI0025B0ECD1|nr:alpha/beta hydrolase [Paracoccus sp. TOH]WJS85595.1 alpha/beta hydrolase [Paracoccus sp. TOH]
MAMTLATAAPAPLAAAEKPGIVLVHGAVMDGSTWRPVHDRLAGEGYRVSIVQMPLTGFDKDVAATKRVLAMQDRPVVLVGHSYGGAVISVAGADPNVKALVYVAAFQPDAGESIAALNARFPMASHIKDVGGGYMIVEPTALHNDVAADLSEADAAFLAAAQTATAVSSFGAVLPAAAWRHKPSYGIVATQDRTVSADLQRFMFERSYFRTAVAARALGNGMTGAAARPRSTNLAFSTRSLARDAVGVL